jgi:hypothetical protein
MAQGAVAPLPTNGAGPAATAALTAEELREILEYERIVQFRDAVLAGTHPRVKIPPHLVGKHVNSVRNVSSPSLSTPRTNVVAQPSRSTPSTHNDDSSTSFYNRSPNNHRSASGAHISMSSKSEINPILLEKSDDLIKAEIQLQRQRLERALREQIEQQRITTKALLQTSESLPNFDLSEVLSKALAIVHPSITAEVEPSVGARSSASDSFDENTFYSSQHDTPEASSSSQGQKESGELQSRAALPRDERPSEFYSTQNQVAERDVVMTGASLSNDNNLAEQGHSQTPYSPAQNQRPINQHHEQTADNSDSSNSRGGNVFGFMSTNVHQQVQAGPSTHQPNPTTHNEASAHGDKQMTTQRTDQELLKEAFEDVRASPLIRAHNLSPLAPQPARVSPLATARDPPILRENNLADEAQPAQVAALRNLASGISSTDSSPKGAKGLEKKKEKKKKKRKTKENAAASPDSPYIKPEPRSPSPFAVAPLPRPQKRQRQSGQYAAELNYDEPRFEPGEEVQERVTERFKEVRAPQGYERYEDRYEAERPRLNPGHRRVEREDDDYRRVSTGQYVRQPQSTAVYTVPYQPSEIRPVRPASHANVDRRVQEEPRYYREPVPRASVRPDADRERSRSPIMRERRSPVLMAPPRKAMRIVVDEYGNEYIDPTPVPPMRQSMAPPIRYRESDVVYERAPMRAVSARAPVEAYEDDGVIYRRPSPPIPRRVITQPEYAVPAPPEYRSYRQREYSVRPSAMAPPGEEFVQIRAPERRHVSHYEEPHREYTRAPSVRPEPMRYEIPREYVGRLQSVRPEAPPREYATSVHPEARREMVPQPQREYSARPAEAIPRREHLTAPEGERYYEEVQGRRPVEVAFIERPRARESSVMVYADDVRREVYR